MTENMRTSRPDQSGYNFSQPMSQTRKIIVLKTESQT